MSVIYPKYKEAMLTKSGNAYDLTTATVKAVLVDSGTYTYSAAHQFLSSLTGTVGTATALASKTVSATGTLDAADTTFTAVASTGLNYEAIVLYVDTGSASTSPLVAYIDAASSGLPVTPNGGDITITWNASGIFTL